MGVKLGNGNWAVKEDKLLAYNDKSGKFFNKEFDFTRGSSATYVAKDGLIKTAGIQPNSVLNSDFSQEGAELVTNGGFDTDSNWTKGSNTTIANGKATTTGTGAFGSVIYQSISLVSGKFYKISIDIEKQSGSQLIARWGSQNAIASLNSTGTFTNYFQANSTGSQLLNIFEQTGGDFVGSIDNVSVVEVGQNWSFNGESEVTSQGGRVYSSDGSVSDIAQSNVFTVGKTYKLTFNVISTNGSNLANASNSRIYNTSTTGLKTFQFVATETGLKFKRYSGVTDVTITNISVQEIQVDTPRIDFTDSPNGALLLEPSSTNLFTDYLGATGFGGGGGGAFSVTENFATSPDGTQNATKLTATSDSRQHKQDIAVIGDNTISCYLKTNTGTKQVRLMINNTYRVTVDVTDQWQRFEKTTNVTSVSGGGRSGLISLDVLDDDEYILVYGLQLENKSHSTSLIPTYGTTATRLTESCNNSGSAQDFNSEEGVLYAEIAALANVTNSRFLGISNGSNTDKVILGFESSSTNYKILAETKSGGSTTSYMLYDLGAVTPTFIKCALKYKANDFALWINGTEVLTDTSGSAPIGLNELAFDKGDNGNDFEGKVRNLRVYTEALTDAELQELTS